MGKIDSTVAVAPQEILESILENLDPFRDRDSLRKCALTARCLLPVAQRALFRSISLGYRGSKGRALVEIFRGLLESSPHIANYPTRLRLDLDSWNLVGEYPFVISRLQNLEQIDIWIIRDSIRLTSPQLYDLLGGSQAPKIRCLRLGGVENQEAFGLFERLAAHRSLQELQLWDSLFTATTQAPTSSRNPSTAMPTIQLRTLSVVSVVRNVANTLSWAISANSCLRFTELRELSVGDLTEKSCPPSLTRILEAAKDSLTRLNFMGPGIEPLPSVQFNTLRHLRTISYVIPQMGPTISYYSPLGPSPVLNPWCIALERGIGLQLDKFIVQMDFGTVGAPSGSTWDPADGFVFHPWERLEAALISGTRTKQLELRIVDSNRRITTDVLRDYLPQCHSGATGCELILLQRIGKIRLGAMLNYEEPYEDWEYRSCSGEWKKVDLDYMF